MRFDVGVSTHGITAATTTMSVSFAGQAEGLVVPCEEVGDTQPVEAAVSYSKRIGEGVHLSNSACVGVELRGAMSVAEAGLVDNVGYA